MAGFGLAGQVQECPAGALARKICLKSSMLLADRANMTHPGLTLPETGGRAAVGIVGSAEMHLRVTWVNET